MYEVSVYLTRSSYVGDLTWQALPQYWRDEVSDLQPLHLLFAGSPQTAHVSACPSGAMSWVALPSS